MQVGDLVRGHNKPKHTDNIGIIIDRHDNRDIRIMWLKDQLTAWYSDYYFEVVCK